MGSKSLASTDRQAACLRLDREALLNTSMQAITAAAISLDAFYAAVRPRTEISEDLVATWRRNKTPRYSQIAEVVRQAFELPTEDFEPLRTNLKSIFSLRDLVVHPKGKVAKPLLHPELNIGVEWRFFYFRYITAGKVVMATYQMLQGIVTNTKPKNERVAAYAERLAKRMVEIPCPKVDSGDG